MANNPLDTNFVDKAIRFAVDAHSGTERRGKGFPYVIHVLEAMAIAASITNDREILAAAVLHDTVEDTEVTLEDLRREFGDKVAELVDSESDRYETGGESWREIKQAGIDRLAKASREEKIVAMGDKLSNMRAIAMDYRAIGDELWKRFHAPNGKADHAWRYHELVKAFSGLEDTDAYIEFKRLTDEVFGA